MVSVVSETSDTPAIGTLSDGNHPGWASRPAKDTDAARRYREAFADCEIDPSEDPMAVVAEAVDAKATVVRNALEGLGDENALNALDSLLDLASLERELIEDGARRHRLCEGDHLLRALGVLAEIGCLHDHSALVDAKEHGAVEAARLDEFARRAIDDRRDVVDDTQLAQCLLHGKERERAAPRTVLDQLTFERGQIEQ